MLRPSPTSSAPSPLRPNTGPPTGSWTPLVRLALTCAVKVVKLATPAVRAMIEKRKEQR